MRPVLAFSVGRPAPSPHQPGATRPASSALLRPMFPRLSGASLFSDVLSNCFAAINQSSSWGAYYLITRIQSASRGITHLLY